MTWSNSLLGAGLLLALSAPVSAQLFGGISEEQEIELGGEAAMMIDRDLRLLEDQTVRDYIEGLGQALVSRSGRPDLTYTFTVVDAPEINAFALPGGFIYVHRGLIEAADSESELAGVLGHEIGHVVARHGVDQMQRAQIASVGLGVFESLLGRGRAATIGNLAADFVAGGAFMKFSRDAEREADHLGARNVADAGLAPRGMLTFFENLDARRERDPNAVERFFSSHPSPAERIENLGGLVDSLSASAGLRADSTAFHRVRTRLDSLPRPEPTVAETGADVDADPVRSTPTGVPASAGGADSPTTLPVNPRADRDREIAVRLAPTLYQALGPDPRFDYITAFDFDGDWRGDNNWANAATSGWGWRPFSTMPCPRPGPTSLPSMRRFTRGITREATSAARS